MDFGQLCQEFGLVGILIGSIVTMFFFLIKWILSQFKVELEENRKERVNYLNILRSIGQEMADHNVRAKEFQLHVQNEHREMITTLGRINGYKT